MAKLTEEELREKGVGGFGRWLHLHSGLLLLMGAVMLFIWWGLGGPSRTQTGSSRDSGAKSSPSAQLHVSVPKANVRATPSTSSEVLGQLDHRTAVLSDSIDGKWCRVQFEGQPAWIHASVLAMGAPLDCSVKSWNWREQYGFISVVGEVKNYTRETQSGKKVVVTFYDGGGEVVNTDWSALDRIPPYGTVTFEIMPLSSGSEKKGKVEVKDLW